MRRNWFRHIVAFVVIVLIVVAGFGQAVLQLWNWLMPQIFGLPQLGFWQAVGLLALSWILFGSWRGFGWRSRHWRHGRDRWERMTPEERDNFRKTMDERCLRRKEADASGS